jgi:di/tricarboxylate transporter
LISESNDLQSKPKWKARLSVVTFIGMILLAALNILPLASAVGAAVMILVLTKTISRENAVNSIDWRVLLIIASSFGIAAAVENSKVSDFIAGLFVDVLHSFGSVAVLAGIYLLTVFYTNFITNNTAAVLMFPIAFSAASELGMGILPFAIAIAVGASSSFATPLGYQTNLMVYGPGGYKFKDYLKIGLPLQIIVAVLSIILINYFYF